MLLLLFGVWMLCSCTSRPSIDKLIDELARLLIGYYLFNFAPVCGWLLFCNVVRNLTAKAKAKLVRPLQSNS